MMRKYTNSTTLPEAVDQQILSVTFPQKKEFLPNMKEFAKLGSKKIQKEYYMYKENTVNSNN
jgi:hypothetical protein